MQARVNAFGEVRAEQDHAILKASFHEWQDYKSLFESVDRFIVVGRRGTGKSALTYRLGNDWANRQHSTIVIAPTEEQMIGLRPIAQLFGSTVSRIRAGVKIAWRYALLMEIGLDLLDNYKTKKDVEARTLLHGHLKTWRSKGECCIDRARAVLRGALKDVDSEEDRIADLAGILQLNRVTEDVSELVVASEKKFVVLIDRLDEGYEPDSIGIGLVDGILYGVDELRLALNSKLRAVVFVRDNIFRAIQSEDQDFSRNLESQVLRLHWDAQELFYMVAKRIRLVFGGNKESDVKTWNTITANELHGREGFKRVLKLTLYRPRDVIALLNAAFYQAQRQGRETLIEADFTASAKVISTARFDDLGKEYESVVPGIKNLTAAFANGSAKLEWADAVSLVSKVMSDENLSAQALQHFRILGSPEEAVKALYGVGFLGLYDQQHGNYVFSHDGKKPDRQFLPKDFLMVHPCYWAGMNLDQDALAQEDAEDIYDEYEIKIASQSSDQRNKGLGQLISELNQIPLGDDGASAFEDWSKRAVEISFARQLANIQHKPNGSSSQRRDIVATNEGLDGFWRRIREDYGTRQVVFEVKNYEQMGVDEYRQVHSYLGKEYGKLGFIICRDPQAGLAKGKELEAFREFYTKDSLIIKITAGGLVSILSKLRSPEKFDAGSTLLGKMLDTHIRLYATGQTDLSGSKSYKKKR